MGDWLAGVDSGAISALSIVRVALTGTPSCVASATLRLHLASGTTMDVDVEMDDVMYETLREEVAAFNLSRRRPRRGR